LDLNQIQIFWVVTLCCAAVGHERFGGRCWVHLQGPPKRWYSTATQQSVATHKTST